MPIRLVQASTASSVARFPRSASGVVVRRTAPHTLRPGYERAKRAFDIAVCLALLPAAALLIALCAVAVLLCDGRPIFFSQNRTGRGGRRFRMYKFRTMVTNAAELKAATAHHFREARWLVPLAPLRWGIDSIPLVLLGATGKVADLGTLRALLNLLAPAVQLIGAWRLMLLPTFAGAASVVGMRSLLRRAQLLVWLVGSVLLLAVGEDLLR